MDEEMGLSQRKIELDENILSETFSMVGGGGYKSRVEM
jgi:hypothetical protein